MSDPSLPRPHSASSQSAERQAAFLGSVSQRSTAKRILAVDDDAMCIELIRYILDSRVGTLWTSQDPNEGLRLAITYKPDLILLDNHMPGMNGIELLAQLRQIPATARIPVMMMTADSSLETVNTAVENHVVGYLLKPVDPDVLLQKLQPWLS